MSTLCRRRVPHRNHSRLLRLAGAVAVPAALAVATLCGTAAAETATSEIVTSSTFVTSSTGNLGAQFLECTYDVVLADGGSFASLSFEVDGYSAFDPGLGCEVPDDGPLAGLSLAEVGYFEMLLEGVPAEVPPGTVLVRCEGADILSHGDGPIEVDYTDLETFALAATGLDGTAIEPPRLCATNIRCESDYADDFYWEGEPECGDANYDTDVGATDSLRALRTAVGLPSCVPFATPCDTDASGTVETSDALRILRAAVGQAVELECPIPCHPGTIGPPGENRRFSVEISLAIDTAESLTFKVTPLPGTFESPEDVQCVDVAGIPHSVNGEGTITGLVNAGYLSHALLYCHYRSIGQEFPDASDFSVVTKTQSDETIEGAVVISSVKYELHWP